MYHIANGVALTEYLLTLYFKRTWKAYPYVSLIGKIPLFSLPLLLIYPGIIMVTAGQFLRSTAMIHASTNFSHSVAFRKRETHKLVTDGVYA